MLTRRPWQVRLQVRQQHRKLVSQAAVLMLEVHHLFRRTLHEAAPAGNRRGAASTGGATAALPAAALPVLSRAASLATADLMPTSASTGYATWCVDSLASTSISPVSRTVKAVGGAAIR